MSKLPSIGWCGTNNVIGSRRLITYRRLPDSEVGKDLRKERVKETGVTASELNQFRKGYFGGFKAAFR